VVMLLWSLPILAQAKYESEFRIKKSEFPQNAIALIRDQIEDVKRLRFYKEIDSVTISFEAKFKKDRLHYSIEFNSEGVLQDVEIRIREIDVPNDVLKSITKHLEKAHPNYKIHKIQQQYPIRDGMRVKKLIEDAFQNLLLPYINYELIVSCKADTGRLEFEYLFDGEGNFISKRKSLPANYDHILY
jgi:hypothetical protein